jgi:glyoxylase-like metal-dependent hydrolase (beta-lactamase superfamily II)
VRFVGYITICGNILISLLKKKSTIMSKKPELITPSTMSSTTNNNASTTNTTNNLINSATTTTTNTTAIANNTNISSSQPPRSRSSPPQNLTPLAVDVIEADHHHRPQAIISSSSPTAHKNNNNNRPSPHSPPPPPSNNNNSNTVTTTTTSGTITAPAPPIIIASSGFSPLKRESAPDLASLPPYKPQRRRSLPGLVDTSKASVANSNGPPPSTPPTPPSNLNFSLNKGNVRRLSSDRSTSDGRPSSTRHTRTVPHHHISRNRFSSSGGGEFEHSDDEDDRRSVSSYASASVTQYSISDRDRAQSFHAVYGEVQSQKRMDDTLLELREFHKRKQSMKTTSLLVKATQGAAAAAVRKLDEIGESLGYIGSGMANVLRRPSSSEQQQLLLQQPPNTIPNGPTTPNNHSNNNNNTTPTHGAGSNNNNNSPPNTPNSFKEILAKMRSKKRATQQTVHHLLRGGVLVETRIGAIQIGVPPETIKDSMDRGFTPNIFVVPQQRFHRWQMISVSEVEFPCFWNFFILPWTHKLKARATRLVVRDFEAESRLRAAFRESLLGPVDLSPATMADDFDPNLPVDLRPDIHVERNYFGQNNVEMFLDFVTLKKVPDKPYAEADLGQGIVIRLEMSKEGEYFYVIVDKGLQTPTSASAIHAQATFSPSSSTTANNNNNPTTVTTTQTSNITSPTSSTLISKDSGETKSTISETPPPFVTGTSTTSINGGNDRPGRFMTKHRRSASDMSEATTVVGANPHTRRASALSQMLLTSLKTGTGGAGRRNSTEIVGQPPDSTTTSETIIPNNDNHNQQPLVPPPPLQITAVSHNNNTTATTSTLLPRQSSSASSTGAPIAYTTATTTNEDDEDELTMRRSRISSFAAEVDAHDDGTILARVPDSVDLPNFRRMLDVKQAEKPFVPPTFGVTFLGTSHGFDPKGSTTGFVVWINGVGMLVDPPPNSGPLLERRGIPPRMIRTVFVTHCHADHDAGTLQKVLLDENVTVVTTNTIIKSFLYKYSKLTNMSTESIKKRFIFRSARVNQWMDIFGGEIRVFYAFHTIPCVGFEIRFGGKSIAYSADTFYDPTKILDLCARGVLTYSRARALLEFPFDADLVLHEAGVPPIHTRLECLQRLTDDVKSRLYLVHIAPDRVTGAAALGLRAAKEGVTLALNTDRLILPLASAITVCGWIRDAAPLRDLTIEQLLELLTVTRLVDFEEGDCVTDEVLNDSFLIIGSGAAALYSSNSEQPWVPTTPGNGSNGGRRTSSRVTPPSTPGMEARSPMVGATTTTVSRPSSVLSSNLFNVSDILLQGDCIFVGGQTALPKDRPRVVATSGTLRCLLFQVADVECFRKARESMGGAGGNSNSYNLVMRWREEAALRDQFVGIGVLDCLTRRQLTLFASMFSPVQNISPGQILWSAGRSLENVYVIFSGRYELRGNVMDSAAIFRAADLESDATYDVEQFKEARKQHAHLRHQLRIFHADKAKQFLCDLPALYHGLPCTADLKVASDCTDAKAFVAPAAKLLSFLRVTPHFLFRMHAEFTKDHGVKKDSSVMLMD